LQPAELNQNRCNLSLFRELKKRNVFRVGIAYTVISWVVLQVVDVIAPILELPVWLPKLILLIIAVAWVPTLVLAWAFELTSDGLKRESQIDRSKSVGSKTTRKLDLLTIGLLLIVIGLVALDRFHLIGHQELEIAKTETSADNQGLAKEIKSIAVLPFVNMSSDPEQDFFSDGISEELLNVLAQFPGLHVAARTSAFQFKGQNRDIAEIARQLRVNHVLEGSVRKSGTQLRITAQLINAESGYHLWSNSWDRELNDIFAIQDEISTAIGNALEIELDLSARNETGLEQRPVELPSIPAAASAQAYEYYLKGRQLINGRSRLGIEQAVTVLERALEHDPSYAPAHVQLAIAITLLKEGSGSYGDLSLDEVLTRATPHVERAFELYPGLAEAYGARALLALQNLDYTSVIENSREALARNPSYVDAMNWLYLALINSGNWMEAGKIIEHMMAVDPLSITGRGNYSFMLSRYGLIDEARVVADELALQSVRASYSSHGLISGDYTGEISNSVSWYLKGLALDPQNSFGRQRLADNFATLGEYDEARQIWPDFAWWIDALQQNWEDSVMRTRQRQMDSPNDNLIKLQLANVLHMSGDLPAAHVLYEELMAAVGGGALIDASNTSIMPTTRMAYGQLTAGDIIGAEQTLDLVRDELRSRKEAGIRDSFMLSAAAMVAAIEGDRQMVLKNLHAAIDAGLRDHFILREPSLSAFQNDPEFQAVVSRLDGILAVEHSRTLELICSDNPAPEVWLPFPETCALQ
jgi:TolB-like protein/Tfp pilus assembly protein PilF